MCTHTPHSTSHTHTHTQTHTQKDVYTGTHAHVHIHACTHIRSPPPTPFLECFPMRLTSQLTFPTCPISLPGPTGDLLSVTQTLESDNTLSPLCFLILCPAHQFSEHVRGQPMILEQGLWTLPLRRWEEVLFAPGISVPIYTRGYACLQGPSLGPLLQLKEQCEDKIA